MDFMTKITDADFKELKTACFVKFSRGKHESTRLVLKGGCIRNLAKDNEYKTELI
jgi:hypothetical protein